MKALGSDVPGLVETVSAPTMPESTGPQVQPLVVPGQVSTKPTDDGQL